MTYSVEVSQQAIIDHLKSNFAQPVHEGAVTEYDTLRRNSKGQVDPYICFQFDEPRYGFSDTFKGATSGDFFLIIKVQAVSSDPSVTRRLSNKLLMTLNGFDVPYGGELEKRATVGGTAAITSMDGTLAAYVAPSRFAAKIQLFNDV